MNLCYQKKKDQAAFSKRTLLIILIIKNRDIKQLFLTLAYKKNQNLISAMLLQNKTKLKNPAFYIFENVKQKNDFRGYSEKKY